MLAIIGGSGFMSLLENPVAREATTPYGKPSAPIETGKIGNKDVALLLRHGLRHEYPPHKIPYKANIYALKELGVSRILSVNSVGSLKESIEPGSVVIPDQLVEFTRRDDTFYHGPETIHIPFSDPYCPDMRKTIIQAGKNSDIRLHDKGTVVIVNGPRFETRAEIDFYAKNGWDIVNMTQYPECVLAKELEICYANVSIITNYCTGILLKPEIKPLKSEDIPVMMKKSEAAVKKLVLNAINSISEKRNCSCGEALKGARL